jgi:large subunit ribosomal protein L17
MITSLLRYERIKTTHAKAREARRLAERMITRARVDSVHNRRIIARDLQDKQVLAKLFVDVAPRFKERPGGYTRILKLGQRPGDAAEMVLLELVERKKRERKPKKKKESSSS